MKIRSLLRLFPLFSILFFTAFGLSVSAHAQDLPWQQRAGNQDSYGNAYGAGSRSGRKYEDPGQPYNPPSQDSYSQSNTQQGQNNRSYDKGYDALRNDNRPQAEYRRQQPRYQDRSQPYAGQPYAGQGTGTQAYQGNQPYQRSGSQDRYGYSKQPYPPQGYQPPVVQRPGRAYAPPSNYSGGQYRRNDHQTARQRTAAQYDNGTYSDDEILDAGHRFFGKITKGLAKVIAHVFKKSGRPNAYILGEEGGGALIAGLRYGEGTVYTKAGDKRRVYWQGPSIGYDFGAEGAKTMILVYNLRNTSDIYQRFGGIDGSAYLVGGVGVTFQKRGKVVMAPIRTGVGLRLGANIGYLKYTRRPTWNPF